MSREYPPTRENRGEDIPLTMKRILRQGPLLNKRRCQIFGSTNKTMKQLLNDGDTSYGDALYKFVTNIYLLTKLQTTDRNTLNNDRIKENKSRSTSAIII